MKLSKVSIYFGNNYGINLLCRILLNINSNEVTLDSLPDIDTKVDYLKKLLFDKNIAHILCLKFKYVTRCINKSLLLSFYYVQIILDPNSDGASS